MSYFKQFKDEIINDGFEIHQTNFDTGETIFEIIKEEAEGLKLVSGQVARNVAKLLEEQTGSKIIVQEKQATACNFEPTVLAKDMVQVYTNQNYPNGRIHQPQF